MKALMDDAVDNKVALSSLPDQVYDLYGVVIHQGGSTSSGHYFSYCKTEQPAKWFECNDSSISSINEQQALSAQAYLLFYSKRIKMEEEQKKILEDKESLCIESQINLSGSSNKSTGTSSVQLKINPV